MTERVAVFIDYQNVHLVGHGLYGGRSELYRCVPHHQPTIAAANDAQAVAWARDSRLRVIRRQLNYRGWPTLAPQEKGIDVAIAVDLIRLAFGGQYDAFVLFSGDSDLLPALETVISLRLGHAEVACWTGSKPLRLRGSNLPWCHFLNGTDWQAVIQDWKGRV